MEKSQEIILAPDHRRQIEELYQSAREHGPQALANAEPGLRQEVEALLAQNASGGKILDQPAAELPTASTLSMVVVGSQLGPYRIESVLGAGGMGEVYRATDTRLGRNVAVKVLREEFSSRFEREARAIAALNHPHICTLYDVGPNYLVMELIEGQTLAARLKRGALPMEQVLQYSAQIADALAAAHARGIIHRDLKPSNIMLTKSGVKVLDFGLAKSQQDETLTASQGVIGTPAYMAPEQREGKECDARTDIYALGLVLREMVRQEQPEGFSYIVEHCLAVEPEERWQSASDLRLALAGDSRNQPKVQSPVGRGQLWWIAVGLAIVAAALSVFLVLMRPGPVLGPETRLDIATPPTSDPASLAISPDGRKIIFSSEIEGQPRLWIRPLDSDSARPLPGTDGGVFPFWSPDSRSIGFFADRRLKRLDIDSGTVQSLAYAEGGRGGAWGMDGTIVFQPAPGPTSLLRISATGGDAVALPPQGRFPQLLPDGHHFLYYAPPTLYASRIHGIYVSRLDGTGTKWLLDADSPAWYAHGYLLFVRQGTLLAQAFNSLSLTLEDKAFPVAQIAVREFLFTAPLATTASGPILYRKGGGGGQKQFVWFDRSGNEIARVGDPLTTVSGPSMSPDGRKVAFHHAVNGNTDVWLLDLSRGIISRFTSNPWAESNPQWSPDGNRMLFESGGKGPGDLHSKTLDGSGTEEIVFENSQEKWPTDWSLDGSFVLYNERGLKTKHDIWGLRIDKDRKPFSVVQTDSDEEYAKFSPDGRWISYDSDESGRFEVYVQPFRRGGAKVRVSNNGGAQVRWRRDGKELFYIALDGWLTAVPLRFVSNGQDLEIGTPVRLFLTRVGGAIQSNSGPQYVVSADGQRFLVDTIIDEAAPPITILLNWKPK